MSELNRNEIAVLLLQGILANPERSKYMREWMRGAGGMRNGAAMKKNAMKAVHYADILIACLEAETPRLDADGDIEP